MLLPFQRKAFTTALNVDDAKAAVRAVINERYKILFFSGGHYSGSMEGKNFTVHRNYPGWITTRINGRFRAESPTEVELTCVPSFLMLGFFSLFSLTFIYFGFASDEMTINGVVKVPDMADRIFFALAGSLIPAIIFLVNTVADVWRLEGKLKERLALRV